MLPLHYFMCNAHLMCQSIPDVCRAWQFPSVKQFLSDYMRMSLTELRGEICQSGTKFPASCKESNSDIKDTFINLIQG